MRQVSPKDKRIIHAERDEEAFSILDSGRGPWLEDKLRRALLWRRLDVKAAYVFAGCEAVPELASRRGYDGREVEQELLLGYALAAHPEVADLLRDKQIGIQNAAALGEICKAQHAHEVFEDDVPVVAEDDRWVQWARFEPLADLRGRVNRRLAEVRTALGDVTPRDPTGQAQRLRGFGAQIDGDTAEDLARYRGLACQRAGRRLSNGELLKALLAEGLIQGDPEAQEPRQRRMPPTASRPEDRGIPAEVVRGLWMRSAGICEFGWCDKPAVQHCHLDPHAAGSGRELTDLAEGCRGHHKSYDYGILRFLGWTNDGLPTFIVDETNEILRPKPRPKRLCWHAWPDWVVRILSPGAKRRLAKWKKREAEGQPGSNGKVGEQGAGSAYGDRWGDRWGGRCRSRA